MSNLIKSLGALAIAFGVLAVGASVAQAASTQADELQPASFSKVVVQELVADNTFRTKSMHVGSQGAGGVTFFNGTITNITTTEEGEDVPVTIGDNLRVDGYILNTEVGGAKPIKVADSIIPVRNNVYSLGTASNRFKNGYFAGSVRMNDLIGDDVVDSSNIAEGEVHTSDLAHHSVSHLKMAPDAISSENIINGSIRGEDIDKNTSLEIDSIYAEGTITQGGDDNGVIKQLVLVRSNGTCARVYNSQGQTTRCRQTAPGKYTIDFDSDVDDRFWQATGADSHIANVNVISNSSTSVDELDVEVYGLNGSKPGPIDGAFMLTVY